MKNMSSVVFKSIFDGFELEMAILSNFCLKIAIFKQIWLKNDTFWRIYTTEPYETSNNISSFLLNVAGNLRMISYACSPNENTDRKKLVSKKGKDQIIHKNPLVLARRGLIRYFISELKKLESGNSDVFEKNREGEIQMKMTCQLYMYSTYSYICENVYWGMEEAKGWVGSLSGSDGT